MLLNGNKRFDREKGLDEKGMGRREWGGGNGEEGMGRGDQKEGPVGEGNGEMEMREKGLGKKRLEGVGDGTWREGN